MEQEGGGERNMNKQQVQECKQKEIQQGDGRGQPIQGQPQQRQQPHACPRCGSLNTKFCYYNNHSLTQPRYFCKSCRRNWTQGGTLRNIPVGGSSRKRKRPENYSSSRPQQPQQPPPPSQGVVVQTQHPNLTALVKAKDPSPLMAPSIGPFYQGGGGYLSSVVEIPPLNPSQSHLFDQSLKVEGDGYGYGYGSSSNFGLASGLNVGSLASQHQIQPPLFYQMGGKEREIQSLYMPQQGLIIPSHMTNSNNGVASHSDWPQSFFINNANNRTYDSSLWSTISCSTTSISGNTERKACVADSSPLIPNQWHDFPGYGPPPSSY